MIDTFLGLWIPAFRSIWLKSKLNPRLCELSQGFTYEEIRESYYLYKDEPDENLTADAQELKRLLIEEFGGDDDKDN